MKKKDKKFPVGGLILIVIGVLFLTESLDILSFHWSHILIVLGALFFVIAFTSSDKGAVFPGTILLLIGLLFILKSSHIIYDPWYDLWPLFPVIVGLAFIILFIFRPGDWGLLIPGGILMFIGIVFLADNYGRIGFNPGYIISRYWPLILIIIGVKLLFDAKVNRGVKESKDDKIDMSQ
ncbi:MAG: hypothetical protein HQ591_12910 [candidate division Zixibacteria bacterium]|nr:hypothetical protein [Candidatus Tariuqbacter arcticus]